MFCPQCRLEYRDQIALCPDCEQPLVAELPPLPLGPEIEFQELVTVFSTGNPAELLVAKSLMESAGIDYYAKGDQLADITGRLGFNPAAGSYEIQVREEDAASAREILSELQTS